MKEIIKRLFRTFLPPVCSCCGQRLITEAGETHVCVECLMKWPRPSYTSVRDNVMARRFWGVYAIEGAASAFLYTPGGVISPVISKIKYHGRTALCRYLGVIMSSEPLVAKLLADADVLLPVPLSPQRLRQRGYNQCHELCLGISSQTGLPIITDAIQRISFRESQTKIGGNRRIENVREAFRLKDIAALKGKHVVLVDDIMTTGSTLIECLMVLRDVPDIRISILTLCQTKS